jgi:hypothetical protein
MRHAARRTAAILVIGMTLCCSATPGRGQQCVGDCDGNARPTIDELVRGVNILLSRAALDLCASLDTNGDLKVAVNELVRAVADILYGCGVTPPTPVPSLTPTQTPPPTLTPPPTSTASPTVEPVSVAGQWREDQYELGSSTCIAAINQIYEDVLSGLQPCDYTLTQDGQTVTATDCNGIEATGQVDETGVVSIDVPSGQISEQGCTIVITPELEGNLGESPTIVQQIGRLTFSGTCPLAPCMVVVNSRWTKL